DASLQQDADAVVPGACVRLTGLRRERPVRGHTGVGRFERAARSVRRAGLTRQVQVDLDRPRPIQIRRVVQARRITDRITHIAGEMGLAWGGGRVCGDRDRLAVVVRVERAGVDSVTTEDTKPVVDNSWVGMTGSRSSYISV